MKRNAIARIVVYSLLILILLGILLTGLGISLYVADTNKEVTQHTVSENTIPADGVRALEIEWAAGNITITAADTDYISFSESGEISEQNQMVAIQNGDTLTLRFRRKANHFGISDPAKDLTITVPRDWICEDLHIEAGAVNIQADELYIRELELDLAAVDCIFERCTIGSADIDAASGRLHFDCSLETMECDAASADISAILENVPYSMQFDSVSGKVDLTLPADAGFSAEVDSLSSGFHSDFDTVFQSGRYLCGDGACRISMDGLSGDLTIRRAK